jgi:hypothetical protein
MSPIRTFGEKGACFSDGLQNFIDHWEGTMRIVSLAAALGIFLCSAGFSRAEEEASAAADTATQSDDQLTGEEIYDRALDNRFYSYVQEIVMRSGGRSKQVQTTEMKMMYLSYRGEDPRFLSKSIAKYSMPQDVRHLGYLVIKKSDGSEDQFVYRPSSRRVRRINLQGEAVFGTDFSMEDILPREIEDATYVRDADSTIEGLPVFVVEVTPKPEKESEYSKLVVYVEKQHYVVIRTHYWDKYEIKIKELNADLEAIKMFEGTERNGDKKQIWVPTASRITQLKNETYTTLNVEKLELDRKLRDKHFSQRKLTASR